MIMSSVNYFTMTPTALWCSK